MGSLKITHPVFDQEEYANVFYSCEQGHPFVVFTTCYCPMCEIMAEKAGLEAEVRNVETALEYAVETHTTFVMKVKKHAPELLI